MHHIKAVNFMEIIDCRDTRAVFNGVLDKNKFQVNILKKIDGVIIVIDIDVIGQLALLRLMME